MYKIDSITYTVLANSPDVSPTVLNSLSAAKASVANVHSATFKNHAHHDLCHTHVDYWESKFETLTVQNKSLDIVPLEHACPLWKRLMYGLPKKQLSLLHAGCDTLPTPMDLARWNIITSPKCALCQASQPTTNHILTGCPIALDQGRYTWRHDSVLQVLVHGLQQHSPDSIKLYYADLPGYLASVCPPNTIQTDLSSTLSRPDLVLVSNNSICLFELTIPTNIQQHLLAARARKEDRYSCLQYDLQLSGLSVNLISIEIGCLGHFMPDTIAQVANACEVAKETIRSGCSHCCLLLIQEF